MFKDGGSKLHSCYLNKYLFILKDDILILKNYIETWLAFGVFSEILIFYINFISNKFSPF